jgi:hypothetical protein
MKELIKELEESIYDCKIEASNGVDNLDCVSDAIELLDKLKEAINYTHCSLQLKDNYSENFAYFVQNKVKEQKLNSIYWYNEISFFSLDSLFEYYQRMIKPLIV